MVVGGDTKSEQMDNQPLDSRKGTNSSKLTFLSLQIDLNLIKVSYISKFLKEWNLVESKTLLEEVLLETLSGGFLRSHF